MSARAPADKWPQSMLNAQAPPVRAPRAARPEARRSRCLKG